MKENRGDEQLVRRMIADDREAFDLLMESYYPRTLRMAYLISGSYADSEDIVQETFIQVYLNRRRIREPQYFERWLYKTLTREAWRICRRSKRAAGRGSLRGKYPVGRFRAGGSDEKCQGQGIVPGRRTASGQAADRGGPVLF